VIRKYPFENSEEVKPEPTLSEKKAALDLDLISTLMSSTAYRSYYLERIQKKIKDLETTILDGKCTSQEAISYRAARATLKEIERMPEEDAGACRNILGIAPI
jgi:hypothetical protein